MKLAVVVSKASVEVAERQAAHACGTGNLDLGVEAEQRGRRVGGEGGPALGASGSDVAEVAILFDAEAAGLAPGERLVVPEAASVKADVAADSAHVS